MKVIAIAAPKGGTGKTTITAALAARCSQERTRVAIIELNSDQGNLMQWWLARGEPANPRLITTIGDLAQDVQVLRASGFEWLFIDTPPVDLDLVEAAVIVADAVVVPVRASILDLGAIDPIVEICKERGKPFGFLLNAVDTKFKKLTTTAAAALLKEGPCWEAAFRIACRT